MCFRKLALLPLLCVLLSCCCIGRCQSVIEPQTKPHTVSGVVINKLTGQPIPRALVQAGQHAMLTDNEGRFEFQDVADYAPPSASKPGYFPEEAPPAMLTGRPADALSDPVELRLVPEAIVSGQVTDGSGEPLEGIPVLLRMLVVNNGLKHWEQRFSATTNAEGEFRLADLQAGEYAVQTAFKLDGPPEGEAAAGYAPVQYPVIGANGAGALKVHAGDHLEANLSTHLERLYPVSVAVNGGPEDSWSNLSIRTADGTEINPFMRRTRDGRGFLMFLPSGTFELRMEGNELPVNGSNGPVMGIPPLRLIARKSITVAQGPVNGLQMTLEPMATVDVEVTEERVAKPPANGQAALQGPQYIPISLVSTDTQPYAMNYPAERPDRPGHPGRFNPGTSADGSLVIHNVPPGKYLLQAGMQPPWYVASATCGGLDLAREPLVIAGSATGCSINVVLRDDASSLKVSVSNPDGSRAVPAFVYVIPLNNLTRDAQTFTTSSDGKLNVDGIAPGDYLLVAMRRSDQLAFRDAESLRRYEAEGKRIELAPGAGADVQLDIIEEAEP